MGEARVRAAVEESVERVDELEAAEDVEKERVFSER